MRVKRDSLLLRIIFYNNIAIIFTSIALALVFSLIVFSSMEQRIADTAREKVLLLYRAYIAEIKDSRSLFQRVSKSVFQVVGYAELDRSYSNQIAENIRYELMKHSYVTYAHSRVTLMNESGLVLGSSSSEGSYQFLGDNVIQEWKKNSKQRNAYSYIQNGKLYFRFINSYINRQKKTIFVILELPVSAYPLEELREFTGVEENDRVLISVEGKYRYGDLDYEKGGTILDDFQRNRFSLDKFEYFFMEKEIEGKSYYMAFYKVRDLESKYIASFGVAISKEKFLTAKYMLSALIIFIVLLLTVISTTICTKLFARLLNPLTAVLDAVYDIGRGNYKLNLEEDAVFEIRNLSNAMEKLARNISTKESQLRFHNISLEKNLTRIDAIQKILMGVNLERNFQNGIQGILAAFTSEAGLGYSRAIYLEYNREKNVMQAKHSAINQSLVAECMEEKEKLKTFSFQLEELERILPLLKTACDSGNYIGRSINENRILYENDKAYRFPFGNDLFHSLGLSHFIILPLCCSENVKSCILLDYYIREREITQAEIELLTLLLLNLNVQLKNKEAEEKKLYLERTSTMEKVSGHFLKDREKLLRRVEGVIDKVEKDGYNKKIVLDEMEKLKKEFQKMKFAHSSLEKYSNFSKNNFEVISMEEFMATLSRYVAKHMKKYEINFSQFVSCSASVYGDVDKLMRAFLELLKNSSDAILARSRLNKKINVVVVEDKKSNQIIINVMDNGIGMYPEEVDALNMAYGKNQKKSVMGLGLSIVSMVIHEHDGDVYFSSKLDEGTDVKIILNIYKEEQHE